jgi:hypothetical protein
VDRGGCQGDVVARMTCLAIADLMAVNQPRARRGCVGHQVAVARLRVLKGADVRTR